MTLSNRLMPLPAALIGLATPRWRRRARRPHSRASKATSSGMRVFAQARNASGEGAPDSILRLENDAAPPEGLTAFDRAFLTTLYESYPYTPGQGNLQRVAKVLREQMAAEE